MDCVISSNFAHLREHDEQLLRVGMLAERCFTEDPKTCLLKLSHPRLRGWKQAGYRLEIVYLKLSDVRVSLERIANRVRSGGHHVPEADARRRFTRSWENLNHHYLPLADAA